MSKKTLQIIYHLISLGIALTTGYIASFSDRWMISVLVICGLTILITYIVNSINKRKRQIGNSPSANKDF